MAQPTDIMEKSFTYSDTLSFIYSFYHATRDAIPRSTAMARIVTNLDLVLAISPYGVVQITGTNGKGSCARQVEAEMIANGRDVITLTSPHLTSFRERVRLNGSPLTKEMFCDMVQRIKPKLLNLRALKIAPTPMEIAFLIALQLRIIKGSETCLVVEVGVGGATDYTNVFDCTVVGLTRIGYDHLDRFGDLSGVAREKVGLASKGGVLISVNQSVGVKEVIEQECRSRNIELSWLNSDLAPYPPSPLEAWQENKALARCLAQRTLGDSSLGNNWYPRGIGRRDRWRFEIRQIAGKTFILDGAHNPDAIQSLLVGLRAIRQSGWMGIFGMLERKLYVEVAEIVCRSGVFGCLLLVRGCRGKFVDPQHLGQLVVGIPFICANSVRKAVAECMASNLDQIVVFGSFSLAYDFELALHTEGLEAYAIPTDDIDPLQPWMRPL